MVRGEGAKQGKDEGKSLNRNRLYGGEKRWMEVKRKGRTYASVVANSTAITNGGAKQNFECCFMSKVERKEKLFKAYVGTTLIPGSTYNIRTYMEIKRSGNTISGKLMLIGRIGGGIHRGFYKRGGNVVEILVL